MNNPINMNAQPTQTEDSLQQDFFLWHHRTFPQFRGQLFHIPNGKARSKREAAILKGMGVVPGIPDLCYVFRGRAHFIEVKAQGGALSPKQRKVIEQLRQQAEAPVWVVKSLKEFQLIIHQIHHENEK